MLDMRFTDVALCIAHPGMKGAASSVTLHADGSSVVEWATGDASTYGPGVPVDVVPVLTLTVEHDRPLTAHAFGVERASYDVGRLRAEAHRLDAGGIVGETVLVDGQAYSPSWRALEGGADVSDAQRGDHDYPHAADVERGTPPAGIDPRGGSRADGPLMTGTQEVAASGTTGGRVTSRGWRPDTADADAGAGADDVRGRMRARVTADDDRAPLPARLEALAGIVVDAARAGHPWTPEDVRASLLDFAGQARTLADELERESARRREAERVRARVVVERDALRGQLRMATETLDTVTRDRDHFRSEVDRLDDHARAIGRDYTELQRAYDELSDREAHTHAAREALEVDRDAALDAIRRALSALEN